jgi:hypothetical protein
MKTLKRIRYFTMNSWNLSTAPAYNLKVYNVIDRELQNKVFELMESEDFYNEINELITVFDANNNYEWQAGFNGRSGGYLVLYKGGRKLSEYKSYCSLCGQRNFTSIKETGKKCGNCGKDNRIDKEFYDVFSWPGKGTEDNEVPPQVLKDFRRLVINIVKEVEYMVKHNEIEEEIYTVEKTRKVIV